MRACNVLETRGTNRSKHTGTNPHFHPARTSPCGDLTTGRWAHHNQFSEEPAGIALQLISHASSEATPSHQAYGTESERLSERLSRRKWPLECQRSCSRNNPSQISFWHRAARPESAEWMAESLCHGPADAQSGLPATWRHQGSQELSCTCPIAVCMLSALGHVQGFAREWRSFQSLPWSAPKFFPATRAFRPPYSVWTVCLKLPVVAMPGDNHEESIQRFHATNSHMSSQAIHALLAGRFSVWDKLCENIRSSVGSNTQIPHEAASGWPTYEIKSTMEQWTGPWSWISLRQSVGWSVGFLFFGCFWTYARCRTHDG